MKFEEAWFILTMLRVVRKHSPLFGKSFHAWHNEKKILRELGWVDKTDVKTKP